ncbi:imidazole glycerol phosphate synthase subunit HisH [uncultured Chitinophaga sp.]|uniref:imidazole glycerol phosphate synthase subunit HisH n=1 Tax=uncultured Chitinophaga sp. TaxID=339340 RepID=UPI0025DAB154|nr:imidazole glycerol phosphate synthase subunit HisH [uncultured Chitinophaga sp.]
MKKKVVIVDYQLGNLFSVKQALLNVGLDVVISSQADDINDADAVVLPGVGAFADAMSNLAKMGLVDPLKNYIAGGKPFMGICLGLQLLFTNSEEFGDSKGLDIIPGTVKKFKPSPEFPVLKVPQISWNQIGKPEGRSWDDSPLGESKEGEYMYFVHSYYVEPQDHKVALTETTYGDVKYVSSILKKNIFACQFHPEKSAEEGLKIYKRWALNNQLI